jgi:signal transduction histidine kinase/CheY-like chemotaxis protein
LEVESFREGPRYVRIRWQVQVFEHRMPAGRVFTRYRVDGGAWSAWSRAREWAATLDYGRHDFEVEALDPLGRSTGRVRHQIELPAPPWRRADVVVPLGLAAVAVAWAVAVLVTRRERHLRAVEQARDAAQAAARAKSEFLASMSHEFRTPLHGIAGMAALMEESMTCEAQQQRLRTITNSCRSLLGLVNDLLDTARIEEGRIELMREEFDLRLLTEAVLADCRPLAEGKPVELIADYPAGVPVRVWGDALRVRQVLLNLVSNAAKFTAAGFVEVRVRREGPCFLLEVEDTGPGIPAHQIGKLFQRFSQVDSSDSRHFSGAGLGLSIARNLARLMGGDVTVVSEPGRGSMFTARLRLDVAAGDAADGNAGSPYPVPPETARALVALAHPRLREVTARTLTGLGYHVILAGAAELTAHGPVELMLLDDRMPGLTPALVLAAQAVARRIVLVNHRGASWPPGVTLTDPPLRLGSVMFAEAPGGETPGLAGPLPIRILLAEDNDVNARLATAILEKQGASVRRAGNGLEAVRLFQHETFDLVLLDGQMPEMDGYEAARRMRAQEAPGARIPIIALTANARAGSREACLAAGMDDFLSKPFSPAELREVCQRWTAAATSCIGSSDT